MKLRINEEIKEAEVRLTGEEYKGQIVGFWEALQIAREEGKDLIEINRKPNPVICIIEDFKKFLYNQKKREKEQEKINKQNRQDLKEVRFGPNTDDHDFEFKKKHAENFLKNGKRVKAYVMFRGREMNFKEQGEKLLLKLAVELEDVGIPENTPKMEGYRMNIFFKPKKKK